MISNKSNYLKHIKEADQVLAMRNLLDKIERVMAYHKEEYTDFYDPHRRKLCYSILNRFSDINYHEEGGYEEAERKAVIIYPSYLQKEHVNNPVGSIEIIPKYEYTNLNHRDYLGGLVSLGIDRSKIGDILVHDFYAHVILEERIIDYILLNINKIGRESVQIRRIDLSSIKKSKLEFRMKIANVASLRVDNIISSVFNMSRSESIKIIRQGRLKVNWKPVVQSSYKIVEGDIISLRRKGKFMIDEVLGNTKKGRIKIKLKIYN